MGVIKTPVCRVSFPNLLKSRAVSKEPGAKEKYSSVLVFGPDDDPTWAEDAIREAAIYKWGEAKAEKMLGSKNFKYPLHLTDDDESPRYEAGSWYLNCYSDTKPGCVHRHADPSTGLAKRMTDDEVEEMIYPGAKIRASIRFFGFDKGSNGVGVGLNNIQLIDATAPRLDGRVNAEQEFEAEEVDDADLPDTPEAEEEAPKRRPAGRGRPRRSTRDVEDLI